MKQLLFAAISFLIISCNQGAESNKEGNLKDTTSNAEVLPKLKPSELIIGKWYVSDVQMKFDTINLSKAEKQQLELIMPGLREQYKKFTMEFFEDKTCEVLSGSEIIKSEEKLRKYEMLGDGKYLRIISTTKTREYQVEEINDSTLVLNIDEENGKGPGSKVNLTWTLNK